MAQIPEPPDQTTGQAQTAPEKKKYPCKWCADSYDTPLELGRHVSKEHRKQVREERNQKEQTKSETELIADIRLRGRDAIADQMRERLNDLMLQFDPGHADSVLNEWDTDPTIRFDVRGLRDVFMNVSGLKPDKISWILNKMVQTYNDCIQKAQMENVGNLPSLIPLGVFSPSPSDSGMGYGSQGFGQQNLGYGRRGPLPPPQIIGYTANGEPIYDQPVMQRIPPTQPSLTATDVSKIVEEALDKRENLLAREKGSSGDKLMKVQLGEDDDKKPVYAEIPASMFPMYYALVNDKGGKRETASEEFMTQYREQTIAPLERQIKSLEESVKASNQRADQTERKRLEDKIADTNKALEEQKASYSRLETQFNDFRSRPPRSEGGYSADAYHFMADAMDHGATVIEKKEPVKEVVKLVKELMKPESASATTATGDELQPLREQGLVDTQ